MTHINVNQLDAQISRSNFEAVINDIGQRLAKAHKWQFRFFVMGVFAYVGWHALEMWLRTS
ncbi:MAG: hypothetical protein KA735_15020 [Burkholderiaceae bacterium]|nr:hypothetical protein [Burkholderiaceae bacterium]